MADARKLQLALGVMTLLGLLLVAFATWSAAGRMTQPLARLDDAAGRLAAGEQVEVRVRGDDELARLADSFNEMAAKIAEREQRITQLAFNDTLTGLPNGRCFSSSSTICSARRRLTAAMFALHCLDLDQFKVINDTLGHPAGDTLLIEAAHRVQHAARGHFVARLGGDEFVVLQTLGYDRDAIDRLARDIIGEHAPAAHASRATRSCLRPASASRLPRRTGTDSGTLLPNADLALYRAKEAAAGPMRSSRRASTSARSSAAARNRPSAGAGTRPVRASDPALVRPRAEPHLLVRSAATVASSRRVASSLRPISCPSPRTPPIVPIGAWVIREASPRAACWPEHIRVCVNARRCNSIAAS